MLFYLHYFNNKAWL